MNLKQYFLLTVSMLLLIPTMQYASDENINDNQKTKEWPITWIFKFPFRFIQTQYNNYTKEDYIDQVLNQKYLDLQFQENENTENIITQDDFTHITNLEKIKTEQMNRNSWHNFKYTTAGQAGKLTAEYGFKFGLFAITSVGERFGYYTPQRKQEIEHSNDQKKQTNIAESKQYLEIASQTNNRKKKQRFIDKAEAAINKNKDIDKEFNKKQSKTNFHIWTDELDDIADDLDDFRSHLTTLQFGDVYFNKIKDHEVILERMLNDESLDAYLKQEGISYSQIIQMIRQSFDNLETSIQQLPAGEEAAKIRACMLNHIKESQTKYIALLLQKKLTSKTEAKYKTM